MPSKTQLDVVQEIIEASRQGREIICLIGAGLSVESGIPALSKLTQYFAKVQAYITRGVFLPSESINAFEKYRSDPSLYLREFGWPDPNQLNADFWRWIDQRFPNQHGAEDFQSYLDYHARAELIEGLLNFDPGLEKGLSETLKKEREARVKPENQAAEKRALDFEQWKNALRESSFWHAGGNWRTLLTSLTDSNPDHADILFQSLIRNRKPSTAHRFLAFLTPILGLRLFLTVNFDDLLEEALRYEDLHPVVYAVSRDSPLPHPSLVRNQLSVVKLHGDAFRLRLGEDLDHPLDEESKKRLQEYLPEQPLLLILGVGGGDRRVLDFVELVANVHPEKTNFPTAYWLHFETDCPKPVTSLQRRCRAGAICPVRTQSPDSLLLELFVRMAGVHPPSFRAYDPKMSRPIIFEQHSANGETPGKPVKIFLDNDSAFDFGASLALARFVSSKAGSYIPIWVDLEEMHTYEEAAAEIIRQIRKYDRSVPPMALPGGGALDAQEVEKPVRRIFDALLRDRYVLALNGVTRFGRPPTWHHWTSGVDASRAAAGHQEQGEEAIRQRNRIQFLRALIQSVRSAERPLRDSILALTMRERHVDPELWDALGQCGEISSSEGIEAEKNSKNGEKEGYSDALLLLAAFRRRRSYVALLKLLPEYLPPPTENKTQQEHVDEFLKEIGSNYIVRLMGGEYWMCRRNRDRVYLAGKEGTRSAELVDALATAQVGRDTLIQRLSLLARIHGDIAAYCYSDLFAASGEPAALLEHLYHQVSSLRYLTKLDAWLRLAYEGGAPKELCQVIEKLVRPRQEKQEPRGDGDSAVVQLRGLRLQRLRALRWVLHREREVLLSLISSDTLIGWIDWLIRDDIPRFRISTALLSAGNDAQKKLEGYIDEEDVSLKAPEGAIGEHCEGLRRQLLDLKADILRGKMDFKGCQALRFIQIAKSLQIEEPARAEEITVEAIAKVSGSADKRRLMRCLYDLSLSFDRLRDLQSADHAQCLLEVIKEQSWKQLWSRMEEKEDGDHAAIVIRWLRSAADHELVGISPWNLRGGCDRERQVDVIERCKRAVQFCDEALQTIEWATGEMYARRRSYFQSLKGRALYIQAFLLPENDKQARREIFVEAYRDLDRAQAGLPPRIGGDREVLAVSFLRLAECQMLRAVHAMGEIPGSQGSAEIIGAERRLKRAWRALESAEEMLIGARQNIEWWACLYQLRAQIQVEHLLLHLERSNQKSTEALAISLQQLQAGLNAIRQGLDVQSPAQREGSEEGDHFYIDRFLRIWVELMLCGATLYWSRIDKNIEGDELWNFWLSLNETAGFRLAERERRLYDMFAEDLGGLPKDKHAYVRERVISIFPKSGGEEKLNRLRVELAGGG